MNWQTATTVVVANMIGTGIFTTSGLMLGVLQSGGMVVLCWLLGGLIALAGALSYAELATQMPRAGGEYVYLREIYGPLPAFLSGWTSFFVGFSAPVAASAVAFSTYASAAGLLPNSWLAQKSACIVAIAVLTVVHVVGLQLGSRLQRLLTGVNLLLLVGLILAGLTAQKTGWASLRPDSGFWSLGNWAEVATPLLWVMFAYSGWNASAYLAEEVERPEKTLPRSLLLGTLTVLVLYLLLNVFLFAAAPPEMLTNQIPVVEIAVKETFGPAAGRWLAVGVALALFSAMSAFMMIGPRVYYAMARDGLFFAWARQIHPRFETPALSIVAQGVCAAVMALTGTFGQLLTYIGFALGIFPWLTVLGVMLLRRREPGRSRPYRVWGYPFIPAFYLVMMAWVMGMSLWKSPVPPMIAVATVSAGIPAYFFVRGRQGCRTGF